MILRADDERRAARLDWCGPSDFARRTGTTTRSLGRRWRRIAGGHRPPRSRWKPVPIAAWYQPAGPQAGAASFAIDPEPSATGRWILVGWLRGPWLSPPVVPRPARCGPAIGERRRHGPVPAQRRNKPAKVRS